MIFIKDYCLGDSSVRVVYPGEEHYCLTACLAGIDKKVSADLSHAGNWIFTIELMEENFVYLVVTISRRKVLSVHRDLESALNESLERNLRHDQGQELTKVSKFEVL